MLQVKLNSENARVPTRGSPNSAGFDLYASRPCTIAPHSQELIHTDISVSAPKGIYFRIAPRSGLALKHMIDVHAGVVDCDYRGNVGVILMNHSPYFYGVEVGDRIAQLIPEIYSTRDFQVIEYLEETERGEGGFGSTGGFGGSEFECDGTPFECDGTPFECDGTPFECDGTPFGGNGTPFGGNGTPFGGNGTPFGGNGTPFGGNGTPFGGNGTPFGGNETPFGGNETPFGNNKN